MGHSIYFSILLESVHNVTVSLYPYVYLSCCVKMTLLSWTHPFSVAFTFCLSPHHHRSLSLKVVVGYEDIPFRNEHYEVSHSLHIVQSWVSVLITIYCKKNILWCGLNKTPLYGYINTSLRVILLLYTFSRKIALGPRPIYSKITKWGNMFFWEHFFP